jgi:predicted metalloprotease
MRLDGQRRSSNFEDRGQGRSGGGGLPIQSLLTIVQLLGLKGSLVVGGLLSIGYFFLPAELKQQLLGTSAPSGNAQGTGSVCQSSPQNGAACDFLRAVLASTEDVWGAQFQRGALPRYGTAPTPYQQPVLVVFSNAVATGCGNAGSAVGPFYCPADDKLYIDPSFYDVMAKRLRAPGDFAQAYVVAHEVGHHIQNLIGSNEIQLAGETKNQSSVRVELQADCLAGVWGHSARATLQISDEDLSEALTAAHAIGDDTLGNTNERDYTHGSSAQRKHWFRRGFDGGDPRQCDTFAVKNYGEL